MSGSITMWGREQMLDAFFRRDLFTAVANVQVALCQSLPSYTATSAELVEPTAPEYARVSVPLTSTYWGTTGFGEIVNRTDVVFPAVALTSWGLIFAWALIDPVSGQCINVGQIANAIEPLQGMSLTFSSGMIATGIYDDGLGL